MAYYLVTAAFANDQKDTFRIEAKKPEDAIQKLLDQSWIDVLYIESVGKECDIDIKQPEFQMENEFTEDDVDPEITCYKDQYVIRVVDTMRYVRKKEYRTPKYQIVKANDGFGCYADKMGTAVFVTDADGEDYRLERYSILGVAKPEALEKWKSLYGEINF